VEGELQGRNEKPDGGGHITRIYTKGHKRNGFSLLRTFLTSYFSSNWHRKVFWPVAWLAS